MAIRFVDMALFRKEAIVERSRRLLPMLSLAGLLFFVGVSALIHRAPNVSVIDAVGLSGSGFALGVGFLLLVLALANRIK